MAANDKTVFDPGATVQESDKTVLESGAAVLDGGATILDAAFPDEAEQAEPVVDNAAIQKGSTILDTYLVESEAIEGGMGSVWRVRHTSWNVDLAMKRPQPKCFSTEKSKADFIHECKAWINLGLHPNIVSCYYVREISGTPSIFSEWMDGGSLESAIQKGSLYAGAEAAQKERLLDIAIQFARGLHYAHEAGLIHQDVKPDNVLLTKEGEAKVADFGLARARAVLTLLEGYPAMREADSSGRTILSPSGGYTPAYCSMEQMDGKPLTRRTDIYSWAVSVMEIYLGARPWANGVVAGLSCSGYLEQARVPMPAALKDLLAQCLNGEPENRPHDFAEIEGKLREIYQAETGNAYPRPAPKAAADTADSLNNRALSFLDLGRPDEAEACWERALALDPNNERCDFNQTLYLWHKGVLDDLQAEARMGFLNSRMPTDQSKMAQAMILMDRMDAGGARAALEGCKDEAADFLRRQCADVGESLKYEDGFKAADAKFFGKNEVLAAFGTDKLTVYDRHTGKKVRTIELGNKAFRAFGLLLDRKCERIWCYDAEQNVWDFSGVGLYDLKTGAFKRFALPNASVRFWFEQDASDTRETESSDARPVRVHDMWMDDTEDHVFADVRHEWFCGYNDTTYSDYSVHCWNAQTLEHLWTRLHPDIYEEVNAMHMAEPVRMKQDGADIRMILRETGQCMRTFRNEKVFDYDAAASVALTRAVLDLTLRPVPRLKPFSQWMLSRVADTMQTLRYAEQAAVYEALYENCWRQKDIGGALAAFNAIRKVPGYWISKVTQTMEEQLARYCRRIRPLSISPCTYGVPDLDVRPVTAPKNMSVRLLRYVVGEKLRAKFGKKEKRLFSLGYGEIGYGVFADLSVISLYADNRTALIEQEYPIPGKHSEKVVAVADIVKGRVLAELGDATRYSGRAISPDCGTFIASASSGSAYFRKGNGHAVKLEYPASVGGAVEVVFSPDSRFMLAWESRRVSLIDTLNPESLVSTADPTSMYYGMTYKFCKDGMHVARLNAKSNETKIAWEISYEYEFPGFHDWDEGARPILEIFLAQRRRRKAGFDELLTELQGRGYGWLRPEGVQKKLKEITAHKA